MQIKPNQRTDLPYYDGSWWQDDDAVD